MDFDFDICKHVFQSVFRNSGRSWTSFDFDIMGDRVCVLEL
jgi:hypothetical protein